MPSVKTVPRQSLALTCVVVRDYDEAIAFYVNVLGFILLEDTPIPEQNKRWVVVAPDRCARVPALVSIGRSQISAVARRGCLLRLHEAPAPDRILSGGGILAT